MTGTMDGSSWKLFLLSCLLVVESSAQDFGQTQFICTSVPKDMDLCAATMQNSGPAEDLKTTVMQLRETVLQQKETIINQKETIKELTSKLSRCESQSLPAAGPGGRRPGGKNTMGDVSRGTTDTLAQLGQTLQTLKQRLENLEVGEQRRAALSGCKVNEIRRIKPLIHCCSIALAVCSLCLEPHVFSSSFFLTVREKHHVKSAAFWI